MEGRFNSRMSNFTATAVAHPNIAFIKYWGIRDAKLHLPSNGSISMNLGALETRVTVTFDSHLEQDELEINQQVVLGERFHRITEFMDVIRKLAHKKTHARIESENKFPMAAGLASSASAFAALALAGSKAIGLELDEPALSRLARRGSGSACRSIPAGFVEWTAGTSDRSSFGSSLAGPEHWDLVDCIALVKTTEKMLSSKEGHSLAHTSPMQDSRVKDAPRRLEICRNAILQKDFDPLAMISEIDSLWMHAVMMTSTPALMYWEPATIQILKAVATARNEGLSVFATVDAGPNVHVITPKSNMNEAVAMLQSLPGVIKVIVSPAGGGAYLV
jgi:diphosphomevalonate decarboxylase